MTWVNSISSTCCLFAAMLWVAWEISASDSARILSTDEALSLASAPNDAAYCSSSSCLNAATSLAASSFASFSRSALA